MGASQARTGRPQGWGARRPQARPAPGAADPCAATPTGACTLGPPTRAALAAAARPWMPTAPGGWQGQWQGACPGEWQVQGRLGWQVQGVQPEGLAPCRSGGTSPPPLPLGWHQPARPVPGLRQGCTPPHLKACVEHGACLRRDPHGSPSMLGACRLDRAGTPSTTGSLLVWVLTNEQCTCERAHVPQQTGEPTACCLQQCGRAQHNHTHSPTLMLCTVVPTLWLYICTCT